MRFTLRFTLLVTKLFTLMFTLPNMFVLLFTLPFEHSGRCFHGRLIIVEQQPNQELFGYGRVGGQSAPNVERRYVKHIERPASRGSVDQEVAGVVGVNK